MCDTWPQLRKLGPKGKEDYVICDTCTRESLGINDAEILAVWVRIPDEPPETAKAAPKKRAPRKKKLRCSLCNKDHLYSDCPLINVELSYEP